MLRLLSTRTFYELRKCNRYVAYCVTKTSVISVGFTSHSRPKNIFRHYKTGHQLCNDGHHPKSDESNELEEIDLDKWKIVMKSKMVVKAKDANQGDIDSDGEENLQVPEDDSKGSGLLEASRDLIAMWRYAGKLVPQEMTDEEVKVFTELTTKSSRKKYLKYLAIREGRKRSKKEKRQRTKAEKEAAKLSNEQSICEEEDDQRGARAKNTFLLHFWSQSMDKQVAWRCAQAMRFNQPLVFDMSYEHNMCKREIANTVSQLVDVDAWNKRAVEPFHLHFCNLQPDGAYMEEFLKCYGEEPWNRLPITCTDQHCSKVFPREQLVYLTADSPNVLRTFDHSKVYIIGALVDRSMQTGLSLGNAKRLQLPTARLPLDEFLHWGLGTKNLTLDQMLRIMLTLKETGRWEEALKFVPQRKHAGLNKQRTEKKMINIRASGVTKESETWLKSGKHRQKQEGQRLPGFTGKVRMALNPRSALTRLHEHFNSNVKGRKGSDFMLDDD